MAARDLLRVGAAAGLVLTAACSSPDTPAPTQSAPTHSVTDRIRAVDGAADIRLERPTRHDGVSRCLDLAGTVDPAQDATVWVGFRPGGDPARAYGMYPAKMADDGSWELPGLVVGSEYDPGRTFEVILFALPYELSSFLAGTVTPGFDDGVRDGRYVDWGELPPGVSATPDLFLERGTGYDDGCDA